jgi:predicted PurR-regulated permease PerM
MNHPLNPNDGSAHPTQESVASLVNLWFAVAVIGLFVFACFYVLKVAVDLFLPIVLAGFLGFLLTPVTRWLKKIGLPNFWAPLVGTLGFFTLLMCLFAALCASLARFQPDLPLYLDHIEERLTPILQAVQKSSPSIDRLGAWLNPGNILQVNIRGPGFLELALKNAPKFFAVLLVVHLLAFFLLLYGARLLKKLVDMIPGVSEKQNVVEIAAEIEQTAARYFTSVTLINACVGVSVWISVGLLGLPHPLLWGVAAFLLHLHSLRGSNGWYLGDDACFIHPF